MAITIGPDDLKRWASLFGAELKVLKDGLRDKGPKYFARPLALGCVIIFASYYFVYKPPEGAMADAAKKLEAIRATTQYAADYQELQERLNLLSIRLPHTKEPGAWLLSEVRETLRQEGIIPTDLSTPNDQPGAGYRLISMTVTLSTGFTQLANWIARIERSKSLMHIKDLKLVKSQTPIGMNKVDVTVTTIVPAGEGAMTSAGGGAP
ncbi:MAG: type 4a pilus biogenesis protein PilO [Elusimicrobia bacterium]|nr:type 4a pilus biogenesis protein PilO [Elusimicrobiota bacterium]